MSYIDHSKILNEEPHSLFTVEGIGNIPDIYKIQENHEVEKEYFYLIIISLNF